MKKEMTLRLVFGAGIGLCVGVITDNIAIGIVLGAGVGLILGAVIKNLQ